VIVSLLAGEAVLSARADPFKKLRSAVAPVRTRVPDGPPRPVERSFAFSVKGWGQTQKEAEQDALRHSQDELRAYLAELNHVLEWRPSLDYIDNRLVKDREPLRAKNFGDPLGTLQGMELRIEINPKDWQDMLRHDRLARADSRMQLLAKLLVGLVAFLGTVAGYLRLEEMTKGYYTAWLRLAAIGFVTAVGAGIWLIS
jgi:hypothetical protein